MKTTFKYCKRCWEWIKIFNWEWYLWMWS